MSPSGRRGKGDSVVVDTSKVPKNAKGGVLVTEEDLKAAFEFFDVEGKGKITAPILRKRLGALFPNMNAKEYRFLMNNKQEMTLDDLREVLLDNEVTNFDPVAEAFQAFDPEGTGYMDREVVRTVFQKVGYGMITDEDLDTLVEAADGDSDGRVGLEDFRQICVLGTMTPESATEEITITAKRKDEKDVGVGAGEDRQP